jgi:hypothetical protein
MKTLQIITPKEITDKLQKKDLSAQGYVLYKEQGRLLYLQVLPTFPGDGVTFTQMTESLLDSMDQQSYGLILDFRALQKIDPKAAIKLKQILLNHYLVASVALVFESPISRLVANFFLGFNRPNAPTAAFRQSTEAFTWTYQHC